MAMCGLVGRTTKATGHTRLPSPDSSSPHDSGHAPRTGNGVDPCKTDSKRALDNTLKNKCFDGSKVWTCGGGKP